MSLTRAVVRDFQSIAHADVGFGDFTVLVGASNSGKSAFLRALRACLRNTIAPANVRQGTAKAVIDVVFDDATVGIERGKSLSTYRLGDEVYTKSGRSVPVEIAAALRLPLIEGAEANFSFQFDRPFLLAETGSQAAQVIGSLTNVSMLHTAVREANRRRSAAQAELGTRTDDVTRFSDQLAGFADLPARLQQVEQAEATLEQAQATAADIGDLQVKVSTVRTAEQALERLDAVEPVDVTALLDQAQATLSELTAIRASLTRVRDIVGDLKERAVQAKEMRYRTEFAEKAHANLLASLGKCPTCGAPTH